MFQKPAFAVNTAGVPRHFIPGTEHAMAGDDNRYGVLAVGRAHRPHGVAVAKLVLSPLKYSLSCLAVCSKILFSVASDASVAGSSVNERLNRASPLLFNLSLPIGESMITSCMDMVQY